MRVVVSCVVALLAALVQVTVSPLFPLGGATADLGLIGILAIALAASPVSAMVGVPVLAVSLAFASDRSPGLLLIAYLPLLPLAYVLEQTNFALPRYGRLLLAVLAAGLWARGVLVAGSWVEGANVPPIALLKDVLLPGMVFDAVFATLLYVPFKLAGLTSRSLTLRRGGWDTV